MENNPTFKQLKITETNGSVKYVPLNPITKQHYTEHSKWLSKEKKEKYKVEEVELSLDEAVKIGISEAIQTKFPPKQRNQNDADSSIVAMLLKQNQELAERLAIIESKKEASNGKGK